MSILGSLADSGLAILSGGATGLVGTAIEAVSGHFKAKQEHQQKLEMAREERTILELEIKGQERVASINAESQNQIAESQAMIASYKTDRATYSTAGGSAWLTGVDVVRGLIRPLVTVYLLVLTTYIYIHTQSKSSLESAVVDAVLYLTITGVTWYYGGKRINHSNKTAKG
ncbi:MAG: hypothetical protein HQL72_09165 [Magnetococcales bacterium]|nr:hypothetical protein [Magnetococcales bacterium]